MRKNTVRKIKGVKVVEQHRKDTGRPLFPRPAVFRDRTKYHRPSGKEEARQMVEE